MEGGIAVAGIAIFIIFLFGVLLGVFAIVCRSIKREDRRRSLKGTPPDAACGGTREFVGVGRRDHQPGQHSPWPGGEHGQGQQW
jgi:hypothetical protein